jgi:hypothetical protein
MLFVILISLMNWSEVSHATDLLTFDDMEKPRPEFSRRGEVIEAKLIPRAKNTSVLIGFQVAGNGRLEEVKGVDFYTVDRPEVNVKNFKSAAFEIRISNVEPGKDVKAAISSDFFSASTAFYVFNPKREKPWMDSQALNLPRPERVRELLVTARDGGAFDADGAADGSVVLIGGPRDSFWGYALGTLFIRFFGIFIVLSVLMIGMILSGLIFRSQGSPKISGKDDVKEKIGPGAVESPEHLSGASEEEVAAIAAALHLQYRHSRASTAAGSVSSSTYDGLWAGEGRKRIMNDRFIVFNRLNRKGH